MNLVLLLFIQVVNIKKLTYWGPIALFNRIKMTKSSGKEKEIIDKAHIACLMYNLLTNRKVSDDLSIGCHWRIETHCLTS